MNRRLLLWMVTAIMTIVGVQQAKAYSTDDLTSAGWSQVTDMTSMTLSDYYFILIDAGSSLYSVSNARPGTDSKPTYQTLQDPISDAGQVWKISNDGSAYYLQSLVDDWYFIGARNANQGWTDYMAAESTNGNFAFAVTDGKFSITSVFANGFVGPWEDADHVDLNYKLHWNALEDNFYEELACNKGAQHAPGFYIYAISRATYNNNRRSSSKLAANGWTQVTGTDQLGKSGYYYTLLDVSEAGYESGLVMAGGTGRPNYQAMNISSDNKIQIWTMASKGDGYQMKNCETDTYVFCNNGTDWNTGFTNDANNQYTEFRFALNNGFWVISNVNSLQRSLGRWSNSPYRPGTGENIAANKADNEGKRQFLIYSVPSIAGIAIALPEGGAMTADQWYYFDVNSEEEYSFNTTTAADIVWTADGTLLESEANSQATALPSGNTNLTARRYYIKSSSDNNFVLEAPRPTTAQIAELQSLITAGDAKVLGFDNGEYAPYNNVEAITLLADAKTLDLNNPNQYTQSFIVGKIAAMQNATWTANTSEVNGIFWKTDYVAADIQSDTYIHPIGWTNTGYNTRVYCSNAGNLGDNNGLSAVNGTAIMSKYNTSYGEATGYTIPLKASTYYKISFKYCGWGNTPTTNVVLTGPNGGVTVTPASFRPETNDGYSNASDWYTYTAIFKTGADAGNYTLALNKVETGQQQIAWGDMVLVRASASDLTYTAAEGPMNAEVATAQATAVSTFENNKTFVNYETLMAAIDAANASIAIYQQIAARLALLAAQTGDIPQAAFEGSTTYTNYDNGVYSSLDQVIPQYKADVAAYWTTNTPNANADLTAFIVNNSFEFGNTDGWGHSTNGDTGVKEASNGTYHFTNSDGNYIFNTWTGNQELHYIFQEIENLPNGTYEVTAVWAGWGDRELTFTANQFTTSETWDEVTDTFKPGDVQDGADETVGIERTIQAVVVNHKLRVGGRSDQFFKCDNFRLKYLTADILLAPELATGQMNADVKAAMLAAKATYDADQSQENYNALTAAIDAANQNIALYQQIKARLDILTSASQLGSISEEDAKAMSFYTKYSDGMVNETADATTGSYTSLDEVVPEYQANIAAYWTTNAPQADDDLTALIANNSFEFGNLDTWAHYNAGDCGARENANATFTIDIADGNFIANFWNNNADVKYIFKDITLPNGTYELKAIFASDEGVTINFTAESGIGADNRIGEVRNTFTTEAAKGVGAEKTLEVVVHNGTLRLGANTTEWFKVDNFRLIFKSANATIAPALVNVPMNAAISTAQTEAYNTWDANKSVANYNALLDAIAAAQASADKYVIINERIPKLDDQTDIDVSALTTKYTNGEYVEADDVFDAYQEILGAYYTTNAPAANADLTAFIINPSFEFGDTDGWNVAEGVDTGAKDAHNGTYAFSNSDGDYVFNTWSNLNPEQFLYVVQDVKHLPNGTYELSAVWATEDGYRTVEFTAENVLPGNVVEGQQVTDSFRPVDLDTRATKADGFERSVTITVTDGTLRIGGHGYQFFKCDNFRLKFLGAGLVDPDPNIDDPNLCLPMNKYEREYYITARDAYNANKTPENLRKANEYRIMVENSIKAYKAAKVTLDHVQEMMNKTNVYTYDAFFTIDDLFSKYGFEGYYGFRTLEDDQAYELERIFFGTGNYRDHSNFSIPAVPFIASAWDCGYQDDKHKGYAYAQNGWHEGDDYYANTWSREGNDDGTNMLTPYLEYWKYGDDRLSPRTMTATVEGTPNATYTVKMFVRVRIDEEYTVDGNNEVNLNDVYPEGMTIQIGDGAEFTPTWTPVRNEGSIYILNNYRKLWVCNLWDPEFAGDEENNIPANLPTGNVGADGTLQIKFNIKEGSNVTWLSMKDVFVNYESEVPQVEIDKLKQQIAYAKLHTPGFDAGDYAPYTNVQQLIALHRAQQVEHAPENVFLVRAVTKALKALNYSGDKTGDDDGSTVLAYDASTDLWTQNTEEMNAFYWKNDYTSADVEHIEWYDYEDDCITPTGWNLIGRDDGFNNGIKKLGVNTGDDADGLKAVEDETVLYAKYETDYGNEPGYTVPLEKGVKYIMTFTYTYAGEGTCPETRVTLTVPEAGVDDTADSHLEVTEFTPAENGVNDMSKWYMYRATFTPTIENEETGEWANYVITFDKDNYDPEPVMFGELTLVRYKEADDVINGDSRDYNYSYEPEFIGTDVQVTRSFNAGAYNTLVLPFKLSGGELKEALGENFDGKVYYYTGVGTTSGENRDYYQLKFEERTGGIFANVPVLIYSDASNPVNNWTNKTFTNMVTKYVKNDLTVDTDVFDFVGTYKTQKIPEGAWYIKADNNFYKSTGSANLQPTRGYFIPYNADGDVILHAKIMGFDIDDEPTGIMAIEEDGTMHVTSGNIYTLDGRLVRQNAKTLEGLPRGTYIVDGKKYMIK